MATVFQRSVWKALPLIPRGKVTTYALVAKHLNTNACRAVGTAVGKNPNAPVVPCHRVVRSDGTVGEYSGLGGVNKKIEILREEGIKITEGRIENLEAHIFSF